MACLGRPGVTGSPVAAQASKPPVLALTGALTLTLFGACGVTNKSLRALTARLLGTGYKIPDPKL